MPNAFPSKKVEDNFNCVIRGLESIGYSGLVERSYDFPDFFAKSPTAPTRIAHAVAFGQTPHSYGTACFAIVVANGQAGQNLVAAHRAVGAPRAFEIREDSIIDWKVGAEPSSTTQKTAIKPEDVQAVFNAHASDWNPSKVLRLKHLGEPEPGHRDFIDLGLIPALEHHIKQKLDPLLRTVLHGAKARYQKKHARPVDDEELVRLTFRALAGKVMNDRGLLHFSKTMSPPADELLGTVAKHYKDYKPVSNDKGVRQFVVDRIWDAISFKSLSVETLAYIWESWLIPDDVRRLQGIHATPPSVARYIVHRLPIGDLPENERRIVEPCCGSGTFLVAALQRLREELAPRQMTSEQRHEYFKRMLSGFDNDSFGLEVARSCLMLADFPNADGWVLEPEDVFDKPQDAPKFYAALRQANVVLCNPPFGQFSTGERERYSAGAYKQVELFSRVLANLPPRGILGFVVPQQVLSGDSYRAVRKQLAERYDEIEVVSLPDKIFEKSEQETALVLGKHPRAGQKAVTILHRKVEDRARRRFIANHTASREDTDKREIECAERSLAVPDLSRIWSALANLAKLKSIAPHIHRGIEWNKPLDENRELLISSRPKTGFGRGLPSAPRGTFFVYQCPPVAYLNVEKEHQRSEGSFELPWDKPKVVMNAKRRSRRGPWKISAFADTTGLICYQTYTSIWPADGWKPNVIAAILNGYVANAFIAATEGGQRDITANSLAEVPIPRLSEADADRIDALVQEYVAIVDDESDEGFWGREARYPVAEAKLNEIDALVLRAYKMPAQLLQELLGYFRRPRVTRNVPFSFVGASRKLIKAMNRPALALVEKWLADESSYDADVWPEIKKGIEESSLSQRKRFHA